MSDLTEKLLRESLKEKHPDHEALKVIYHSNQAAINAYTVALVEFHNMDESICKFNISWVGRCKNSVLEGSELCEAHHGRICASCGVEANHDCEETGQFVCGSPLCPDCEHVIFPDGTNGGIGFNSQPLPEDLKYHCKKTDQKHKPWYTIDKAMTEGGKSP